MSEDGLEEKALEIIKSRPNGVLQSDLWKELKIDSRKCSRIIARLESEDKIKRIWETVRGTRTFRITYKPQKAEKKEADFGLIMAGGEVAPCVGCTYECEPDYCPDLGNWIELLAKELEAEEKKAEEKPAPPIEEEAAAAKAVKAPVSEKPAAKAKKAKAVSKSVKSGKK
ncbi:putative B-block binding subunit of TFIIIC [Methanocella conradii HZ254]|uniref:B-block binding subunit of TFIIIC n=1 Tax=Methanocella conradii (strain DSM 24694 / JCM 17849 / CGMCC 1.5162 / HZ254) TaxID=1041930 RepID=H8I9S8_METCZ|nr:TFIIIC protein [Methanocella conradii]AFD00529.1 putative B-block binding subunit of TFIIIC [Methanocella conradii HZ254]MDI6896224.1 transcription factor TFIIIC [Methanocella conradii]